MTPERHPAFWHARGMEQRVSFVTFAVRNLSRSRAFYVDGLGWTPELEVPGEEVAWNPGPIGLLVVPDTDVEAGVPG